EAYVAFCRYYFGTDEPSNYRKAADKLVRRELAEFADKGVDIRVIPQDSPEGTVPVALDKLDPDKKVGAIIAVKS
ncbi:MAG: hypothetical protein KKD39_05140, partial [Candidatus Altiarchaeota archaeon]|nr:hypothetical protein [Candidatus Altiarchaeota archaeon]